MSPIPTLEEVEFYIEVGKDEKDEGGRVEYPLLAEYFGTVYHVFVCPGIVGTNIRMRIPKCLGMAQRYSLTSVPLKF